MAFSLTYAFSAKGRHIRKISREARGFVGDKFRNLKPGPLRDYLFAQYFAIDGALYAVFYNDDPSHPLYPIHIKYGNKLLETTESDFRHLGLAYAFSLLAIQSGSPQLSVTEEDMAGNLNLMHVIASIYDGSQPPQLWTSIVLKPDYAMIAATLCQDIAKVMQLDPRDKTAFANDWVSLIPSIIAETKMHLMRSDWSKSVSAIIKSVDFGGTQQ